MTSTLKFLGIMHKLGTENKTVSKVYRRMLDIDLFIAAYTELAKNEGRLTPGTTDETIDGASRAKLEQLIEDLRNKTFKWTPVRRTYIPKSNNKLRPLGMPMVRAYCTSFKGCWGLGESKSHQTVGIRIYDLLR